MKRPAHRHHSMFVSWNERTILVNNDSNLISLIPCSLLIEPGRICHLLPIMRPHQSEMLLELRTLNLLYFRLIGRYDVYYIRNEEFLCIVTVSIIKSLDDDESLAFSALVN